MDGEETLQGVVANASAVVRSGDDVLRPSNQHSALIHAFLTRIRARGFHGASEPVSIDPDGRERLRFVPGDVPYPPWAQTDAALASVAMLIRGLHDASIGLSLEGESWSSELADPDGGPVMCHNDVCLENVVFRDGSAVALLDFDFAARDGESSISLRSHGCAYRSMTTPTHHAWVGRRTTSPCDFASCATHTAATSRHEPTCSLVCPIRSPVAASSSADESKPARSPSSRCGTTWAAKSGSTADANGGPTTTNTLPTHFGSPSSRSPPVPGLSRVTVGPYSHALRAIHPVIMSDTTGRSSPLVEMRQRCARTPEQVYALTPAGGSPPNGMMGTCRQLHGLSL